MKRYLGLVAGLALIIPGLARAQFEITAQVGGIPAVSGATLDNFDGTASPLLTLSGAYLVTGSDGTVFLPPYLSGSTAAFFGESPANGLDASQYVAVEANGSAALNFPSPQDYFGLLWGSVNQWSELDFYNGQGALVGAVMGSDVVAPMQSGSDSGIDGTYYVNITSATPFSKVVASTPVNSFEFDDIAYATDAQPIPESPSTAWMAGGLGLIFLALNRNRP